MSLRFSIVVPAHNAEPYLAECLESAVGQDFDANGFEILLVDDGSTDGTLRLAHSVAAPNLRIARTEAHGGPGLARNRGVELARGEWILFLDADDTLEPGALSRLDEFLARPENAACDAVGFDWHRHGTPTSAGARHDADALALGQAGLIERYLSLQTDGSVIFTLVRRELIEANGLRFAPGLHEDVDYLFRIYWHARRVGYVDAVLYAKRDRAGSIVNSISRRHIDGFLRAWAQIGLFLEHETVTERARWLRFYRRGLVGLLATRVREIGRRAGGPEQAAPLYRALHDGWQALLPLAGGVDLAASRSQYFQIASVFLDAMARPGLDPADRARAVEEAVAGLLGKSWSCTDLHHSVFLAPDQVRTCCKRFFVEGEMRGDVVLLDRGVGDEISAQSIARAKRALHTAINRDQPSPCDGCPFLEFKAWGPIEPLRIDYLSFEHHSVCNLVCTYCSETYYGGVKPRYDVPGLVDGFIAGGQLEPRATVVWGGGEPVGDRNFTPIITSLVERLPGLTQRVLTNAVTWSPTIERLLAAGRITVTTSIDAGTPETFARVRGRDRMARVLRNLERYAAAAPARVTIKYIFTEGNETLAEVRAFVAAMAAAGLTACNFQISHDFKRETVDEAVLGPIVALYGLLAEAGARVLFFDDLLRHRLVGMDEATAAAIRRQLAAEGIPDAILDPAETPALVIWGAGWQAKYLLENAAYFRRAQPAFLVDSTPAKIGGSFMGHSVRDPRALLECDLPVLIAAVQGYPAIHGEFVRLGLSQARLVTRLVI